MAVTKKFIELIAKINSSNVAELLRQVGETAVKAAYSSNDAEPAQFALDNLPDVWRDPLAKWLKGRGLLVAPKTVGSSRYLVGVTDDAGIFTAVKSRRRQEAAFAALTEPVIVTDRQSIKAAAVKKIDETKSPKYRAEKAAEKAVKALKKADPAAAAVLGAKLSQAAQPTPDMVEVETALIVGGEVIVISPDEAQMLKDGLLAMRLRLATAA